MRNVEFTFLCSHIVRIIIEHDLQNFWQGGKQKQNSHTKMGEGAPHALWIHLFHSDVSKIHVPVMPMI